VPRIFVEKLVNNASKVKKKMNVICCWSSYKFIKAIFLSLSSIYVIEFNDNTYVMEKLHKNRKKH